MRDFYLGIQVKKEYIIFIAFITVFPAQLYVDVFTCTTVDYLFYGGGDDRRYCQYIAKSVPQDDGGFNTWLGCRSTNLCCLL
ncbi:MFS transporter [Xenorhabdus miraniensis]|uniref:MFS transporter n=1 Tax=Xenorhabdus miraniensis TaxID=351674 RepID=A0A2D0JVE4_9GAMM|nr:MFS transporter [Xenorhabdus miraniensis]